MRLKSPPVTDEPARLVTLTEVADHDHKPTAPPAPQSGALTLLAEFQPDKEHRTLSASMGRNVDTEIDQVRAHLTEAVNVLRRIVFDAHKANQLQFVPNVYRLYRLIETLT